MRVVTLRRHLFILAALSAAACGGGHGSAAPSPAMPDQTVEQFLTAVNATNLDQMAMLWGNERGPEGVTHSLPQAERQQRLTIMQRMLRTDTHMITGTDATDPAKRIITVAMTQGTRRFAVPFTLVPTRAGGWIIREIGLDAAMPSQGSSETPRP
jgi:hypothetical protein